MQYFDFKIFTYIYAKKYIQKPYHFDRWIIKTIVM